MLYFYLYDIYILFSDASILFSELLHSKANKYTLEQTLLFYKKLA